MAMMRVDDSKLEAALQLKPVGLYWSSAAT